MNLRRDLVVHGERVGGHLQDHGILRSEVLLGPALRVGPTDATGPEDLMALGIDTHDHDVVAM